MSGLSCNLGHGDKQKIWLNLFVPMYTLLKAHATHLLMEPLHIGCGLTSLLNHVCVLLGQPLSSGSSSFGRLH